MFLGLTTLGRGLKFFVPDEAPFSSAVRSMMIAESSRAAKGVGRCGHSGTVFVFVDGVRVNCGA